VQVLIGIVIGLIGVALLVGGQLTGGNTGWMTWAGSAVVLVSGMCWAGGSVYSSWRPICASTTLSSGMQMLSGGFLLLLLSLTTGDFRKLNLAAASWVSITAFFYLLIFGSLIGFTAYSWLLRNVAPARAATYAYVNPAVAVFLGWLIASEPITLKTLSAAAVIVVSVVLITTYGSEGETGKVDEVHSTDSPPHPCA
jgi:drug/metabolite transporter (DMT)-like permease